MSDTIHDIVSRLIVDTKGSADSSFLSISKDSSIWAFLPELIICATIVLMLLVRVFRWGRRIDMFYFVLIGSGLALWFAAPFQLWADNPDPLDPGTVSRMEIFTGMLVYDTFSVFVRALLLFFVFLFAIFTKLTGLPDRDDGPDIYTLVLGSTLGMCLMVTANHLLIVFVAVEMASVPSYALAAMQKGRKRASEAALKYSVYGAGTAGVMLYGISLIAGLLNTAHLPTMAVRLAEQAPTMETTQIIVLGLAGLMISVGLAFKLSAVPFHFWCPDVFEGATAEVDAFLSIASKGAALALLVRVAIGLGTIAPSSTGMDDLAVAEDGTYQVPSDAKYFEPGVRHDIQSAGVSPSVAPQANVPGMMSVADDISSPSDDATVAEDAAPTAAVSNEDLYLVQDFVAKLITFLAVITCTFGNLAAYGQTNIKRLLAYSTIAHAGYMMMAVPVILAVARFDASIAQSAVAALCIYLGVYLFMNLGAFAIVAFLRNAMRSEEIADYGGLIKRCPGTVICFGMILFSLVGLPPLAGFIGKFAIFAALADGYTVTSAAGQPATYLMLLLFVGGINTAISLFYYLRVVKVMAMSPEPEDRTPFSFSMASFAGFFVLLVTVPTFLLFLFWGPLNDMANAAAQHLIM